MPFDNPLKKILLRAGWLVDGTGGPIRSDILVQIENGVIVSLKKARQDDLKASDVPITDLSHCTLLPGLVDCHVHPTMSGTNDPRIRQAQLNFSFDQAKPVIAEHIRRHLSHGIVALRDGGDSAGHTLRYKNEHLFDDGFPVCLKAAGKAWRARGRYGRLIGRPPSEGSTLAECIDRLKTETDHIKIIHSGLNSLTQFGKETPPQFSQEELDAAVEAGRKQGLKTMVHANGRIPVRTAVEAGCHSIEHGFFMGRENLDRMAELQVVWVPTAYSMKAYSEQLPPGSPEVEVALKNLDHQLEQLAYARKVGVPVAVGTDSGGLGLHHGASFAKELELLTEAGFSPEEVVRCAASVGARLLGLDRELGLLKRGMPATFVVVRGDPSRLVTALQPPEKICVRGNWIASVSEESF